MSINCYTFVTNKATKHKRVNEKLPGRGPTTLAKTVRQRYDNFSVPQEKINIMKPLFYYAKLRNPSSMSLMIG